ncbi:hypothetical protein ACTFIW_008732 [Dictyostelium discoideum]
MIASSCLVTIYATIASIVKIANPARAHHNRIGLSRDQSVTCKKEDTIFRNVLMLGADTLRGASSISTYVPLGLLGIIANLSMHLFVSLLNIVHHYVPSDAARETIVDKTIWCVDKLYVDLPISHVVSVLNSVNSFIHFGSAVTIKKITQAADKIRPGSQSFTHAGYAFERYVLTTDASESGAGATLKKGNKTIKTWSTTQPKMSSNRREMLALLMAYQALWWSDTGPISSVRTTWETMPQEESELDWRSNQELQLATEEGSVLSHSTSVRSNPDGSIRISSEPSNVQLLNNQNECTPPRLESMETMSGLPTTHSFAFYPGEDELIQFEEGFYNTDLPNLEISNLVSDDSSSSSSSSSSHVSSNTGNIPSLIHPIGNYHSYEIRNQLYHSFYHLYVLIHNQIL